MMIMTSTIPVVPIVIVAIGTCIRLPYATTIIGIIFVVVRATGITLPYTSIEKVIPIITGRAIFNHSVRLARISVGIIVSTNGATVRIIGDAIPVNATIVVAGRTHINRSGGLLQNFQLKLLTDVISLRVRQFHRKTENSMLSGRSRKYIGAFRAAEPKFHSGGDVLVKNLTINYGVIKRFTIN
jgi:hypothetical protein